jgi:cytochrome c2
MKPARNPASWTREHWLPSPGWLWLLAGALGGFAAAAFRRPAASRTPDIGSHLASSPRDRSVSFAPLVGSIVVVIAATGLWAAYQAWDRASEAEAVARALTGGDPGKAAALVTRFGCGGCHTIAGVPGADGKVAPPLAGIRERVFVGGVLPNTADNLMNWIVEPQAYSPNSAMPVTGISKAEARDVAAFLYAH